MQQIFSIGSDGLRGADKFDLWHDISRTGPIAMQVAPSGAAADFAFRSSAILQKGLGVMTIRSSSCQISRDPDQASDLWDGPGVVVNVLTAGELAVEQDGRQTIMRPGDAAICVSDRPYTLQLGGNFEACILKFDRRLLSRSSDLADLTATILGQGTGLGTLLFDFARNLAIAAPHLEADTNARLMRNFVDLLETNFHAVTGGQGWQRPTHRRATFNRVAAFVRLHLREQRLTPGHVAAAVKLSPRYLNKLFAAEGTSLGRYIWETRLSQSAVDLLDPALSAETISAIALRNGFKDLSHFSRSFRARFDASPTEYRESMAPRQMPLIQHGLAVA